MILPSHKLHNKLQVAEQFNTVNKHTQPHSHKKRRWTGCSRTTPPATMKLVRWGKQMTRSCQPLWLTDILCLGFWWNWTMRLWPLNSRMAQLFMALLLVGFVPPHQNTHNNTHTHNHAHTIHFILQLILIEIHKRILIKGDVDVDVGGQVLIKAWTPTSKQSKWHNAVEILLVWRHFPSVEATSDTTFYRTAWTLTLDL